MPAWLAKFDTQTIHSFLIVIAVWVALYEAHFPIQPITYLCVAAILAVGFKEGMGKIGKSPSA